MQPSFLYHLKWGWSEEDADNDYDSGDSGSNYNLSNNEDNVPVHSEPRNRTFDCDEEIDAKLSSTSSS